MSFAQILLQQTPPNRESFEPLADLAYPQELRYKNAALAQFWSENKLGGTLEQIVPAVLPRAYRTTTKRRALLHEQHGFALGFEERIRVGFFETSNLEPDSHNKIYGYLFNKLATPAFKPLARALNWLIIRGNYTQHCVIFNVVKLDATIVRKSKQLADALAQEKLGVTCAMMYVDPTRSEYYLEAERPETGLDMKHLFGPRLLTLAVEDLRLKYPPTVFSQVNEAMVPTMVEQARSLLQPTSADRLLDMYCGYGLFTFTLGRKCKEALGIELAGESIATAIGTALHLNLSGRIRFKPARITADLLKATLPPISTSEILLLDPPRKGCEAGVIATLAARNPRRVLHICCGTDEIVPAVRDWNANGYQLDLARPLDLFPGTANLETLLLLTKK
jgi:tRNA/tmRNA/rRNA uracil-C5-methylase (TrmA/RlmC/RlmD family)